MAPPPGLSASSPDDREKKYGSHWGRKAAPEQIDGTRRQRRPLRSARDHGNAASLSPRIIQGAIRSYPIHCKAECTDLHRGLWSPARLVQEPNLKTLNILLPFCMECFEK